MVCFSSQEQIGVKYILLEYKVNERFNLRSKPDWLTEDESFKHGDENESQGTKHRGIGRTTVLDCI